MLYTFYGNDIKKVLGASQKLIEGLKAKREFAQVFYFYPDNFNKENLEIQQSTQGLFFDKHIFVFKNFIEAKKDIKEYVLNNLENFILSNHLYIVLENDIDNKYLDKIKNIKDINLKEYKTKIEFKEDDSGKLFNLAALIMKTNKSTQDKVSIITQIDDIKKKGNAPEEFFGILWWRYKKYASNDKQSMKKLLDIYHDSHGGEEEMWIGLERWMVE
jgi:hypothetical protein